MWRHLEWMFWRHLSSFKPEIKYRAKTVERGWCRGGARKQRPSWASVISWDNCQSGKHTHNPMSCSIHRLASVPLSFLCFSLSMFCTKQVSATVSAGTLIILSKIRQQLLSGVWKQPSEPQRAPPNVKHSNFTTEAVLKGGLWLPIESQTLLNHVFLDRNGGKKMFGGFPFS